MWNESTHQLQGLDQEARVDTVQREVTQIEADTAKEPLAMREILNIEGATEREPMG